MLFWYFDVIDILIIIKNLIPQLLYTQIIFCVQIRVCDFFTEWKVILPDQISIATAISKPQWMLHYTATLGFVIKAISSAALQLPFCFWWLVVFVVNAWVDTLFSSAMSIRVIYRSHYVLWDVPRHILRIPHKWGWLQLTKDKFGTKY